MAINQDSKIIDVIDKAAGETEANEAEPKKEEYHPVYKMYKDARIPVSKATGKLWKARKEAAQAMRKNNKTMEAWEEAIRYYKNDQTGKRDRSDPDNPSTNGENKAIGGSYSHTENVVFSNVSALVPSIYAKNPDISVHSPKGDDRKDFTDCAQRLVRTLMQKRAAPGINLKPKMRRSVVMTTLTNISYIEVGYTRREVSSEGALDEVYKIAEKLKDAKNTKQIEELEGQLLALDDKVDLLQPAGPWSRHLHPKDVIFDDNASLPDGSDSQWMMVRDVHDTAFLNAVYREKDEQGEYRNIYKATHVMAADSAPNKAGHDDDLTSFSLLSENDDDNDPAKYGYDNEAAFKRAQRTYVWKVWDKTTKRVYMFAENDWNWPIWVWDDPYGFEDFFPVFPLAFHTDPEDMFARGEASYYLDQQDEINLINSQVARMRHRIVNQIVYNKRAIKNENDLKSLTDDTTGKKLVGVDVPEGMKISEMLDTPPIPTVEYGALFDKRSLFEAVDRVSGVSSVVKGVEYKTNTTNKAIDSYESSSAMRLDEKIDAIEEQVGRIGHALIFLCLQFMPKDEVVRLIGDQFGQHWPEQMTAQQASQEFTLTVTGGSSLKPTSKVRKEQAKELGQVIGQFGQASPAAFLIVIKMFQRAFSDEIILEPEDWDFIMEAVQSGMQAEQQQPQQPQQGGPEQQGQQLDPRAIIKQISAAMEQMPPELRAKVGKEIAEGVPLEEVIGKLLQTIQAQQGGQQPQ